MKSQALFTLAILYCLSSFGQIIFEPGYFIDNDGKKTECLIKNLDWDNCPKKITYKKTESSPLETALIGSIQGFGVLGYSKYERLTVEIDRSSDVIRDLSENEEPEFQTETLFLKKLIEGKADLYSYRDGNLRRFFYAIDGGKVEQLIFKRFKKMPDPLKSQTNYYGTPVSSSTGEVRQNNKYRVQLWKHMRCEEFDVKMVNKLSYSKKSLISYFTAYHACTNSVFVNYDGQYKRDLFNLKFRPGFRYSSLSMNNTLTSAGDADFGSQLGLRLGIEAEFILPFLKNKWGLATEVTYQAFDDNTETDRGTAIVNYQSLEFSLGLRHYFYLNDQSKFFLKAAYIIDSPAPNLINYQGGSSNPKLEINTSNNFSLGGGYVHENKYSVELNLIPRREILQKYLYWSSNYQVISMVFGYRII